MEDRLIEREKIRKLICEGIERNMYLNIEIIKYYDNSNVEEYNIKFGVKIFKEWEWVI